jgi:hypothetical protein
MSELRNVCDRPTIYGRAEPDDEYDPLPKDPNLTDQDEYEIEDDDELDEDNYSN